MLTTIYETLLELVRNTHSSNMILHYIETKKWFRKYKSGAKYMIPYKEWLTNTLINKSHIEILNKLISTGNGKIICENGNVYLEGNRLFKSKTSEQHIEEICKIKQSTIILHRYLEEFYYLELLPTRRENSRKLYHIEYNKWISLFDINAEKMEEISRYIKEGKITVVYSNYMPKYIDIEV